MMMGHDHPALKKNARRRTKKKLLGLETECRQVSRTVVLLLPFFLFLFPFWLCSPALPALPNSFHLSSLHLIRFISSHLIPKGKKNPFIITYVELSFFVLPRLASPPYLLGTGT